MRRSSESVKDDFMRIVEMPRKRIVVSLIARVMIADKHSRPYGRLAYQDAAHSESPRPSRLKIARHLNKPKIEPMANSIRQ